jgi:hypothetical protein
MLANKLLSTAAQDEQIFSDSVFSTYLYTGNGSTQTITNGIDLAGKGGMVWIKSRSESTSGHVLFDTARTSGVNDPFLQSNTTAGQIGGSNNYLSYLSNGFQLSTAGAGINDSGNILCSWTFRKSTKFFDVVTYTGNGVAGRQIAHSLGVAPGMVIVKRTDTATNWLVWHTSLGNDAGLKLNLTDARTGAGTGSDYWGNNSTFTYIAPTASEITVSSAVNASGATYVAYLFAHDTSTDGIIQCGSFTQSSAVDVAVSLAWEPQYFLIKRTDSIGQWHVLDDARGLLAGNNTTVSKTLYANLNNAEADLSVQKTATGVTWPSGQYSSGTQTYIYLAIRRPNKPPTTGTQVYNAIARTGTGAAATVTGVGFAPDLAVVNQRTNTPFTRPVFDRLRGPRNLIRTNGTQAELDAQYTVTSFESDGVSIGTDAAAYGTNSPSDTYINHFFRRAPGVFDVVCYTGTGSATTVAHGLGVAPELMIVKRRNIDAANWAVYHKDVGNTSTLYLNLTSIPYSNDGYWNNTTPTNSVFTVGNITETNNGGGYTYVAYLFASKAGISKVGSFTGNGSSQTINCGFSTGARFVLIKATSTTGDWLVGDSTRGLVAGNDPYLKLNSTTAEVTAEDWLDPDSSGFIVNNTTAAANTNGVTYIYLAFA